MHHLFGNIERLAVVPAFSLQPIGILDHDAGVSCNAIAMERRLGQPSLPPVKGAFTRQESVSQHPFCAFKTTPFFEMGMISHEYVLDVLRMINEEIVL